MKIRSRAMWSALAVVLLVTCAARLSAAGTADLGDLNQEILRSSQAPGGLKMVWWMPEEFWSASFTKSGTVTEAQGAAALEIVRKYTMIAVVDGKLGAFGGVTYRSAEDIRKSTRIVDAAGTSYAPLTDDEISPDARNLLQVFKPILANMLGPMGENLQFMMFPARKEDGAAIADAKQKGHFKVMVADEEFEYRLPLDSVLPGNVCPSCKETCKGSWLCCPWCGAKLAKK